MYSNPNDGSQLTVKGNEKNYLNVPVKNYGRRSKLAAVRAALAEIGITTSSL